VKLYTFWRHRRRSASALHSTSKASSARTSSSTSIAGDQFKPEYKAQNPQAVVPTLYDCDAKLFQFCRHP